MLDSKGEVVKRDKPNWREAFEQVIAKAGQFTLDTESCEFCRIVNPMVSKDCEQRCPVSPCTDIFLHGTTPEERVIGCRYVLKHGGDFIDYDDARRLTADALSVLGKDDAREKFLGKPEKPKVEYIVYHLSEPYKRPGGCDSAVGQWADGPNLNYAIRKEVNGGNHGAEDIIAAFRDKDTWARVLAFLNGETDA